MYDVLLVRYGEIALKGKNRHAFEDKLVQNLRLMLEAHGVADCVERVEKAWGRVVVRLTDGAGWQSVIKVVRRVFGVVSVSPARQAALDLQQMKKACLELLEEAIPPGEEAVPFRVAARRANKRFPKNSMELNQELGAFLLGHEPRLKVDLVHPRVIVSLEVREDFCFIFVHSYGGPGGLPVGSNGKALALLSGGIDSPVAMWMIMKRGVAMEGLHFHSYPLTSERARLKVLDLGKVLSKWVGRLTIGYVPFTEIQKAIQRHVPEELRVIVMRRMMLRIASHLAQRRGALVLVTGESVGQVASQTLESMTATNAVSQVPVLRPLVGLDKEEIIERARRIGTYEISIRPYEDCCTLFVPKHPATKPRLWAVEQAEQGWNWDEMIQQAAATTEWEETAGRR